MNGESCEEGREPVAGFRVKSGRVRVMPGEASMFQDMPGAVSDRDLMGEMTAIITMDPSQREHKIGLRQIEVWAAQVG